MQNYYTILWLKFLQHVLYFKTRKKDRYKNTSGVNHQIIKSPGMAMNGAFLVFCTGETDYRMRKRIYPQKILEFYQFLSEIWGYEVLLWEHVQEQRHACDEEIYTLLKFLFLFMFFYYWTKAFFLIFAKSVVYFYLKQLKDTFN